MLKSSRLLIAGSAKKGRHKLTRRDNTPRVFDVSKPNRVSPDPTSRPIIVGHRPVMNDPMVRKLPTHPTEPAKITSVPVIVESEATSALTDPAPEPTGLIEHQLPVFSPPPLETPPPTEAPSEPFVSPQLPAENVQASETAQLPAVIETPEATSLPSMIETSQTNPMPTMSAVPEMPQDAPQSAQQVPPVTSPTTPMPPPEPRVDASHLAGSLTVAHAPGAGPQTGYWRKPLLGLAVVILLLVSYGVADAKTGWPLPFHPFRQTKLADTTPAATIITPTPTPPAPQPAAAAFTLPAGWLWYENQALGVKFAYPKDWGAVSLKTQSYGLTSAEKAAGYKGSSTMLSFSNQKLAIAGVVSRDFNPPGRDGGCYINPGVDSSLTLQTLTKNLKEGNSGTSAYKLTTKILKQTGDTFTYEHFEAGTANGTGACPGLSANGYKFFSQTSKLAGLQFFWGDAKAQSIPLSEFSKYQTSPNSYLSEANRQNFIKLVDSAGPL